MIHEYRISGSFQFLFLFIFIFLVLSTSFFISQLRPALAIGVAIAIALFFISFLDTNMALYILILSMLLSPEFGQRTVSGQGIRSRA